MTREELFQQILRKKSFLCIGLDSDISRLPKHLLKGPDPVFEFNKQIIEATKDLCVAYKPNLAFYEVLGSTGWRSLEKTLDLIRNTHFTIADAKRGDIGNTSTVYARAFFETMDVDALTVAPYMGEDSVTPFLQFPGKWVVLLALTSNKGSIDFQMTSQDTNEPLFEKVLHRASRWGNPDNLMFVVGATHPEKFAHVRSIVPDYFLLVPGIGAQGGDLESVCKSGMNHEVGLLVNSSREIIFASSGEDFAEKAREHALRIQECMAQVLHPFLR